LVKKEEIKLYIGDIDR